jgi:glycosyltransferase involved in cell wall biosynthesis
MPIAAGNDGLAGLYGNPREVSCLSPHLSLWRRDAARIPGVVTDLAHAGRFDIAQLALALRERGLSLLERPFVAAQLEDPSAAAPARQSVAETEVPGDVTWMRVRLKGRLEDDPCFHPALSLTSARVAPAPRFAPRRDGVARICAFPFDRWGSGEMRVRQPCAALERAGLAEVVTMDPQDSGRAPNGLEWERLGADTLLAHNFFHDFQLVALDEYARRGNALRVLGMDDLLTDLPGGNPYAATIYPDIAARIARAVARCDRLVVSTQELADAYGRGTDVRVIPNAIDPRAWVGLRNNTRTSVPRPRVGWAGARQHLDDLLLLEKVVAATAHEIDWIFLGMCPPPLRRHAAEFHAMVPVGEYPAKLAWLGLDVAVAPLQDNAFNRAKSDLKILEYGMLGIPVVASAVGPYRETPALLAGDRDGWIDAVRMLARDPDAARERGAALRNWVLTGRTLIGMLPPWRRALSREG